MATPGVFLLMVLVALSTQGANSRPTHNQLTALVEALSDKASDLYDNYCEEVSDDLSASFGMTQWERCEHVANQYRAMCNVPQLTTLSHQASHHHHHHVMYHTFCKYGQLRTSLLDDVCEGAVRKHCSYCSPVCEAEGQSYTCNSWWRSEACLCVSISCHGLVNDLTTNLTPEGSMTCAGIDQYLDPAPQEHYIIRGCMLAFLHGLKQQAKQFKDAL